MAWTKKQRREMDASLRCVMDPPRPRRLPDFKPTNKTRVQKGRFLAAHGWHCAYCGRNLTPKTATKDHVVPRVQGGGDAGNILPACLICNRLKGPLTLEQFKEVARSAYEYRRTANPGSSWRYLFCRFGQVGVRFYCEGDAIVAAVAAEGKS